MQEKYYLRKWELSLIVINLSVYRIFTGYAKIFSDVSGPSAPITALFSGVVAWFIIWGLLKLYEKNENKTLIKIATDCFGRAGGTAVFIILALYLLFSSSLTLRETGELISAVSFPTAPVIFILLIVVLGAVVCCAQGFNAIANCHSVIIPITLIIGGAVLVMGFSKGEISYLTPYLGYGIENTFIKGLSSIGLYSDLIILFMLFPFAKEKSYKRTALWSIGAGVLINALVILGFTMIAPYAVADTISHPFMQLVKLFSAGRFFQRIDGYFMYAIAGCGILSLARNIFFISYGAKEVFSLPKTRPLSYSLGLLVMFLSLLPKSRERANLIAETSLWPFMGAVFLIVFLLGIVYAFKRRKRL